MKTHFYYDRSILFTALALIGLGLVQVYSSSFIFAIEEYNDGFHFVKRQFVFSLLGIAVLFIGPRIPWRFVEKYGFLIWVVASVMVALTFIPGLGVKAGGATRWLHIIPGLRVEPGELMKIGLVVLLAFFVAEKDKGLGEWKWAFRLLIVGAPVTLLLFQPDFGTFALCLSLCFLIAFAFGLSWKHIIVSAMVLIPSVTAIMLAAPYRRKRLFAFMDPWSDPDNAGFQLIQSMLSFHSGGLFGEGLGEGQGKLFFLPEAHTDFTLAVLGEEMGYIGFIILLTLYGIIIFRGFQISFSANQVFVKAFTLGLTLIFGLSVFTNIGVVLGLLPTKGLTLPFLSYGGSSLLTMCILISLLLNAEAEYRKNLEYGNK